MIAGNNGSGNTYKGAVYLSSGTLTTAAIHMGDYGGNGYLNMTGGSINANQWFTVAQDGGMGQLDMSGGTITVNYSAHILRSVVRRPQQQLHREFQRQRLRYKPGPTSSWGGKIPANQALPSLRKAAIRRSFQAPTILPV